MSDSDFEESSYESSTDTASPPDSSISSGDGAPGMTQAEFDLLDDEIAEAAGHHVGRDGAVPPTPSAFRHLKRCTRATSLGQMEKFTDKMLLMIVAHLRPKDIIQLGYVSWMWLAVAHDEPTWRTIVLRSCVDKTKRVGSFCFHGTWRRTMMYPKRFPGRNWNDQDVSPPLTTLPSVFFAAQQRSGGGAAAAAVVASSEDGAVPAASQMMSVEHARYWMIESPHRPRYAAVRKTKHQRNYDTKHFPPENAPMFLGGVDRRENLTYVDFVEQYERPNRPVIITDAARDWPAKRGWQADKFIDKYGETLFLINVRSTKGYKFRMAAFDYFAYTQNCNAEKFLYIFDKKIFRSNKQMRKDYNVPVYFSQDLLSLMEEDERPDYRWLLIGPGGIGSPFHTDPHATSAWNCVLHGAKRVSFYPPNVLPPGVDKDLIDSDVYPSDDMMYWYQHRLPKVKPQQRPIECVVLPGEVLFIPSMWWHSVMNIGLTIAVTQNYCSLQTFPYVAHNMNTTSGRTIRKDFKCALMESQYKPLADHIIVNKKRAAALQNQQKKQQLERQHQEAAAGGAAAAGSFVRQDAAVSGAAPASHVKTVAHTPSAFDRLAFGMV